MSYWHDKSIWITGASSGIGAALARSIGAAGGRVGLIARNKSRLQAVAESVRSEHRPVWATADVRDRVQFGQAADSLEEKTGPCEILIANAGVYRQTPVGKLDAAACREVFEINMIGIMHSIERVLPSMFERKQGHLVAIASLAGRLGLPTASAYCASKAAVVCFMESLRMDLRPEGVAVTTILPGHVDTPMITEGERSKAVPLPKAVKKIQRAIERRKAEYAFPWHTVLMTRAARLLPPRWFDFVVRNSEDMEEAPPLD